MQSKKQSLQESILNVFIGYITALIGQILIFPLFDIDVTAGENLLIGACFTILSLIRSYTIRRLFNKFGKNDNS